MGKNLTHKDTQMTSDIGFMEGSLGMRKGAWTKEEDKLLKQCIETHGEGKWHQIPLKAGTNFVLLLMNRDNMLRAQMEEQRRRNNLQAALGNCTYTHGVLMNTYVIFPFKLKQKATFSLKDFLRVFADLNRCRKSCRLRWLHCLKPNIKRGKFEADEGDLMIRLHKVLGNRWSLIAGRLPGRTANDVKNYWNPREKKGRTIRGRQEREIQQVTKANIIKPRVWCFPKNLDSSSSDRTRVFKNNVLLGGDQNHHNSSTALQAASENTGSLWWECLLNDTAQEEPPSLAGLSGESAKADGTSCGGNQSFLSDFSFDADVWNLLNAEI